MQRFVVFVWVPSKGFKIVLRTSNHIKAYNKARELEPLTVKVEDKMGKTYYGGYLTLVDWETPNNPQNLETLINPDLIQVKQTV